jgi:hypothetical protein
MIEIFIPKQRGYYSINSCIIDYVDWGEYTHTHRKS